MIRINIRGLQAETIARRFQSGELKLEPLPSDYVEPTRELPIRSERFRITEMIGRGCWGKVYGAYDEDNTYGTIKVLNPNDLALEQMRSRGLTLEDVFAKEIQGSNCLGVVERHLEVDYDGKPFIWMPKDYPCTLKSFRESLVSDIRYRSEENFLMLQVISGAFIGCSQIHSLGIVHGDLSPSNILLDNEGHSVIADFGCSSIISSSDWSNLPKDNIGHPSIRAPELYHKGSHHNFRSEVYSMGAVLFYSIVGREPRSLGTLSFDDYEKRMRAINASDADSEIEAESKNLPLELRDIFAKAMAFNPADRHYDCVELNNGFEKLLYQSIRDTLHLVSSSVQS